MEETVVSITKKAVETKLINSLLELLKDDGFVLRKNDGFLIRKSKSKVESVYFRIVNYWPLCQRIDYMGFSVRFDKIEEIVNPFLAKYGFFNIAGSKKTATILSSIWYEIDNIITEKDVDNFIALHMNNIKTKVLDYFNMHSNIYDVNNIQKKKIINDKGIDYDGGNLLKSLTLMKLCGDIDFDTMKIKYRQLLNPSWERYQEMCAMYDDLVEYLSRMEQ
jgi:hypothetical protein